MTGSYVCLARVYDPNLARVAAARLQSEGLAVRVHGESTGPFPVTVGALAETQIWVAADEEAEAGAILHEIGIICAEQS
jgi:hypothetical protein